MAALFQTYLATIIYSYTRRQEEKDIVVMKIILNLNNNREDSVMFIENYNYVSNFRHS